MKILFGCTAYGVLGALLLPALALAQPSDADRATARALGQEGLTALEKQDFVRAADLLSRADKLYHAPTLTLGLARAQLGLSRWVSAQEMYYRLVHEPVAPDAPLVFRKAVDEGKKELAALEPRIPFAVITVEGPKEVKVVLDGEMLSADTLGVKRPVDPGPHRIKAEAAGYRSEEKGFAIAEKEVVTLRITMKPLEAAPGVPTPKPMEPEPTAPEPSLSSASQSAVPSASAVPAFTGTQASVVTGVGSPGGLSGVSRDTLVYTAFGIAGAGVVVGGVTGIVALNKKKELSGNCINDNCLPAEHDAHSTYRTMGLVSTVGFLVGVAGAGTGAALLLTATKPSAASTTQIIPTVGWGSAGVIGRF